jgi:hypothetical protein
LNRSCGRQRHLDGGIESRESSIHDDGVAATLILVSSSGRVTARQTQSINYALAEGVSPNDPAIIDSNVGAIGQSKYVEVTGDAIMIFESQSACVILLPARKPIHRVVIHSPNLLAVDIWITNAQGDGRRLGAYLKSSWQNQLLVL